jgi:hypothetical protein
MSKSSGGGGIANSEAPLLDPLSPSYQKELMHLVNFVQKVQQESSECTFHPNINPKSYKILTKSPSY